MRNLNDLVRTYLRVNARNEIEVVTVNYRGEEKNVVPLCENILGASHDDHSTLDWITCSLDTRYSLGSVFLMKFDSNEYGMWNDVISNLSEYAGSVGEGIYEDAKHTIELELLSDCYVWFDDIGFAEALQRSMYIEANIRNKVDVEFDFDTLHKFRIA